MDLKHKLVPEYVFEAFNEMIAKTLTMSGRAQFKQDGIFRKKMLDITSQYTASGWIIDHDRPGYNESYDAVFIFDKK